MPVTSAPVPSVPDEADVTASWLAAALGCEADQLVGLSRRSIGTGQVGENVRCQLDWSADTAGNRPETVVGKFPSLDPVSFQTALATEAYLKEVGFYRDLQARVDIETPTIRYLAEDQATNRFVLIMDDVTPASPGDQLAGCSVLQAELAVDEAARLHGPHWGRHPEQHAEWLVVPGPERWEQRNVLYAHLYDGFAGRYRRRLGGAVVDIGRWLGTVLDQWSRSFVSPLTLVHGDFRLDNMLFGAAPTAAPITVVDWQTTAIGYGPSDVAYFLGAGLSPETRRQHERELVARYGHGLARYGMKGRDLDEVIWTDYRLGSATGYVMAVIASQIVVQTDRGDEMFCVMAERHAEQMVDLDLAALLA